MLALEWPKHCGHLNLSELIQALIYFDLTQVAVPSRTDVKEYQDLKEEMDKLVGMINGKFSTPHWSPIRYIYGCIEQVWLGGKVVTDATSKALLAILLIPSKISSEDN